MDIETRRIRHKINKANARNKARRFIASYFETHSCADCGESDPIVLTFDHVRGEKIDDIASMVQAGLGLETIKAEIEKCEVRGFNCHAIRTHQQMRSNRWQRINKRG